MTIERPTHASGIYDLIGGGYARTRRGDPRIAGHIAEAIGSARSIANVGAGSGSYEPHDRTVIAVEPSATMVRQRSGGAAHVVRGVAEQLPLTDRAVDASLAILTVHHWTDPQRGFSEMRRVARHRVVVLTWDQDTFERFWLVGEYLPALRDVDRPRALAVEAIASTLGDARIIPIPIPSDCRDGFLGAFWQRPEAYLDERVRAGISAFAGLASGDVEDGLARLAADVQSGAWEDRHRELLGLHELDVGYRLIVATNPGASAR